MGEAVDKSGQGTGAAHVTVRRRLWPGGGIWTFGALAVAGLVLMPILAVVWLALTPDDNIWPHLLATTLPRYLTNTAILALGTGALSAAVGAGAAWLVTMYRFPLSGALNWLLLLPLAIPAYVGAYALVDFLEFSGPVQTALRATFGWTSARDYWFPEIRSRWAAVLVLSAALYPYAYMLARAAFRDQPAGSFEAARALGAGPVALFWRLGLPLARPAIAAGAAIAMMETVADYGVVDYFAVQTLTTGIFSVWLEAGNVGGAAQIAVLMLAIVLALVVSERTQRRRLRYYHSPRQARPFQPMPLGRAAGLLALALCLVPLAIGFVLPLAVLAGHAFDAPGGWLNPGLGRALVNTLATGGVAAALTVAAAFFMLRGARMAGGRLVRRLLPVTTIGYGAPGAVLAVGILLPVAALDHRLADAWQWLSGHDPGLLLTGSATAIVYAYVVRFFALGQGAVDAALGRIPPSLPLAARTLGRTEAGAMLSVTLPLMRGSIMAALLLVFVDCVKELPATLLLRPFNFDTLATRLHEKASLENLGQAAPPALMIIAVGLIAVGLLARSAGAAAPAGFTR